MLDIIAKSIRENENIKEKRDIDPIVRQINEHSYASSRIFTDIGEDSASIMFGEKLVLMTTDRIRTDYIERFPQGAGFSSILVGADDIYCCGGTPLAASLIISFKEKVHLDKIIQGAIEGSNKFRIPIVRGHTSINRKYYELSSTTVGEILKEDYISAQNAKAGDVIILAIDEQGKIAKANNLYWDTVTFKTSEEVLSKRASMNEIAQSHLAHSAKDIANGGIMGSILQLCKYSEVGADISIDKIQIPPILMHESYDIETFLKMYLTTSYIITAQKENSDELITILKNHKMSAFVIGKIIKETDLMINNGLESLKVFEI
jgi:selenophosphate synthetase-related protein